MGDPAVGRKWWASTKYPSIQTGGKMWRGLFRFEGNQIWAGSHPTEEQAAFALSKYDRLFHRNCELGAAFPPADHLSA